MDFCKIKNKGIKGMVKTVLPFYLFIFLPLFLSCSNIDENERLIYVEPAVPIDTIDVETDSTYDAPVVPVSRRVLIEDHTGQKCPNCPDATAQIHEYQKAYGALIIPVAIHSQMQGIMEPEGLGNELGNTYYNHWKLEYKPAGLISRMDGGAGVVMDKTIWTLALQYIITLETPLDVRIKAQQNASDPTKADIDVKVINTREGQPVSGKLQVWITEDGIIAPQDYLNGIHYDDYQHDHVLRAAVNGDWGEDVSVSSKNEQHEFHYTTTLKSGWKADNLYIVAFVYTDNEVVQAARTKLKI
jgi:hypothetical protein